VITIVRVGPASIAWTRDERPVDLPTQLALLSPSDRERAAGLAPARLNRFLQGRLLLRDLVGDLFPDAVGWLVQPGVCRKCGLRHAGTELEGVPARASVSYAAGLVVAAVAPTSRVCRLGVDVEPAIADSTRVEDLRRLLGASTEPVVRRWTRVEAVLKADGRGLLIDPGAVWLRRGGAWIAGEQASYVVAEVGGPPGYLISLAWCAAAVSAAASGTTSRRTGGPAGARWPARPGR
jgi:4'-phosphopantetheinyl transferase